MSTVTPRRREAPAPLRGDRMMLPIALAVLHASYLLGNYKPLADYFAASGGLVDLSLPFTLLLSGGYLAAVAAVLLFERAPASERADPREAMLIYNIYMALLSAVMCGVLMYKPMLRPCMSHT